MQAKFNFMLFLFVIELIKKKKKGWEYFKDICNFNILSTQVCTVEQIEVLFYFSIIGNP